ncbi:permease [Citrobacter freundii]|nr:permease [Citrobacter freundii]
MSGLKQELGLAQGVGLLSTSLLGTGVFAVPALAALVAGNNSLWAWPVLIVLVFPVAIVFAVLGRHFPSAGGVAHFVGMAFGSRLERVTGWLFFVGHSCRLACGIAHRRRIRSGDVWLA